MLCIMIAGAFSMGYAGRAGLSLIAAVYSRLGIVVVSTSVLWLFVSEIYKWGGGDGVSKGGGGGGGRGGLGGLVMFACRVWL